MLFRSGYGVLFATAIVLLLIPALYLVLDDVKRLLGGRALERDRVPGASPST